MTTTDELVDVEISGSGTVYLVKPVTERAEQWIQDNVAGETTYLGDALAVEHRYIFDLAEGMAEDGLIVR